MGFRFFFFQKLWSNINISIYFTNHASLESQPCYNQSFQTSKKVSTSNGRKLQIKQLLCSSLPGNQDILIQFIQHVNNDIIVSCNINIRPWKLPIHCYNLQPKLTNKNW